MPSFRRFPLMYLGAVFGLLPALGQFSIDFAVAGIVLWGTIGLILDLIIHGIQKAITHRRTKEAEVRD